MKNFYPKEEDYKQFIRVICVVCGGETVGHWQEYLMRGNYCSACNAACNGKSPEVTKMLEILDNQEPKDEKQDEKPNTTRENN